MNKSTTSLSALLVSTVAILTAAGPASAYYYRDTSAATVCHASNGAAENKFSYHNNYLTNNGTTNQFVVCSFTSDDPGTILQPYLLSVSTASGGTAGTVRCSAQVGSYYQGADYVLINQVRASAMAANSNTYLNFDTSTLTRASGYQVLTMNCVLPPGFKLGLIESWAS